MCITNGQQQKARPKGVNLRVRQRTKFALRCWSANSALRAMLVWEGDDRSPKRSVGRCGCGFECLHDQTPGQGNPYRCSVHALPSSSPRKDSQEESREEEVRDQRNAGNWKLHEMRPPGQECSLLPSSPTAADECQTCRRACASQQHCA